MQQESSKIYQSVVMEIRPRLQSVNVYVLLKQKTCDFNVTLNHNSISIAIEEISYHIPCMTLNILPESLSSVQISENHLSFRFQTSNNPKDYTGRFKVEFLQPPQTQTYVTKSNKYLKKSTTYSLCCTNCSQPFCKSTSFQRVLPLPSENLDLSNWFCHGHSVNSNTSLNPNVNDVFYTETYVHLACSLLENVRCENVIVCKRCLIWLGLKINDLVARVWFNTVSFKSESETVKTSPLTDINIVTSEILSNSFLNTAKIVFHCQVTNTAKNYILLWVVEKQLNIIADVSKGFSNCDVAKVLFKFEETESTIVSEWQNETITSVVSISKSMMIDLLKHLYRMNKFFPKEFSVTNGFFVSYLCLYDNNFL